MTTFSIDVREIRRMAAALDQGPAIVGEELVTTTNALAISGIGLAQDFAPVKDGFLRASIHLIQAAALRGSTVVARYGTGLVYARIQEEGGVIVPRTRTFLSWIGDDGRRRFARSVRIPPKKYMFRSGQQLEAMAPAAYEAASGRIAARIEGAM